MYVAVVEETCHMDCQSCACCYSCSPPTILPLPAALVTGEHQKLSELPAPGEGHHDRQGALRQWGTEAHTWARACGYSLSWKGALRAEHSTQWQRQGFLDTQLGCWYIREADDCPWLRKP